MVRYGLSSFLLLSFLSLAFLPVQAAKGGAKAQRGPAAHNGVVYPQCLFGASKVVRWIPERMPIKIYVSHGGCLDSLGVDPSTGGPLSNSDNVANWPALVYPLVKVSEAEGASAQEQIKNLPIADAYSEELWRAAVQGINQWKPFEKEGLFSFEITADPDEASVFVFWTHHFVNKMGMALFANDIRGYTSKHLLPYGKVQAALNSGRADDVVASIRPVVVVLRTTEQVGAGTVPMSYSKIMSAAEHEMGHVLGIDGHSANRFDLMSVYYGNGAISPNDAASIRYIYRHNPDFCP